jgi:RNA polymerase sigma-70 factor (ECF subfamily)
MRTRIAAGHTNEAVFRISRARTGVAFPLDAWRLARRSSIVRRVGDSKGPAQPPSDPVLVARMVEGDRRAVAELYARHVRGLYSLAQAMLKSPQEAEDLIHDVFLEAWRRSADYREARGTVRAWLFMRARSRALDRLKSAGKPRIVEIDGRLAAAAAPALGDQLRLRELLSQMPEEQRQVLFLGYFAGLSSAEIAERLGIPTGTVKSRTRAALGVLRTLLSERDD